MYLARENTNLGFPEIGRRFGGRNQTTVMHAVKRTAERMISDREGSGRRRGQMSAGPQLRGPRAPHSA